MAIAYMRLEGLLQAYGKTDVWCDRGTYACPSKSAVLGMLGAMLGLEYGSSEVAQLAEDIAVSVRVNNRALTEYLPVLRDFHTMTARLQLDGDNVVQRKLVRLGRADGGLEADAHSPRCRTELRHKEYLQDASFTVFLQGDATVLQRLCEASLHPVYVPYLGRACCFPSAPVWVKMSACDKLEEAWQKDDIREDDRVCEKGMRLRVFYEDACSYVKDHAVREEYADVPLGDYQYGHRFVYATQVFVGG